MWPAIVSWAADVGGLREDAGTGEDCEFATSSSREVTAEDSLSIPVLFETMKCSPSRRLLKARLETGQQKLYAVVGHGSVPTSQSCDRSHMIVPRECAP